MKTITSTPPYRPAAKVYRIAPDGESRVIYEPGCDYIWALAFDSRQRLYLATGDRGEIHRISTDGAGGPYFETGETHVRSLAIDEDDNLIAGTDPGGLLMRIVDRGAAPPQGFVLYQSPRAEITAIVRGRDGIVYASGVGDRAPAGRRTTRSAPTVRQAPPPTQTPAGAVRQQTSVIQSTRADPRGPARARRRRQQYLRHRARRRTAENLGLAANHRLPPWAWTPRAASWREPGDAGRLMRIDSDTLSTILTTRDGAADHRSRLVQRAHRRRLQQRRGGFLPSARSSPARASSNPTSTTRAASLDSAGSNGKAPERLRSTSAAAI